MLGSGEPCLGLPERKPLKKEMGNLRETLAKASFQYSLVRVKSSSPNFRLEARTNQTGRGMKNLPIRE